MHLVQIVVDVNAPFSFNVTNRLDCDFTANRLDNDICHSLDNVEPMCYSRNRHLSNKLKLHKFYSTYVK